MKTAIQELIDDELNGDTKSETDYYLELENQQIIEAASNHLLNTGVLQQMNTTNILYDNTEAGI